MVGFGSWGWAGALLLWAFYASPIIIGGIIYIIYRLIKRKKHKK